MKTQTKLIVWSVMIVTSALSWSVSSAAEPAQKPVSVAVDVLNEKIVECGTELTIGLSKALSAKIHAGEVHFQNNPNTNPRYQWRKNDNDILGKTNDTLTFNSVTHNDAGKYTVVVKGPVDEESAPVYVTIYTEITNSSGDAFTVPVGAFSPVSGTTVCGGNNFVKWKSYTLYGKNVTGQVEPFANPGFDKLTVNTCSNLNSSVNTAIVIQDWDTGIDVACNDRHNTPCEVPGQGNNGVSRVPSVTLNSNHTYKVTIWIKSTTQANVGWRFLYF